MSKAQKARVSRENTGDERTESLVMKYKDNCTVWKVAFIENRPKQYALRYFRLAQNNAGPDFEWPCCSNKQD